MDADGWSRNGWTEDQDQWSTEQVLLKINNCVSCMEPKKKDTNLSRYISIKPPPPTYFLLNKIIINWRGIDLKRPFVVSYSSAICKCH